MPLPSKDVLASVELVVFDVDGVFTDGRLYMGADGKECFKVFHVRDGYGVKQLIAAGVQVAIISGRSSGFVAERMKQLGVQYVYQGREDKIPALQELTEKLKVKKPGLAYMGDDTLDLPAMARAGLGIAVADAHPTLKAQADWVTEAAGGRGAVREVCDAIVAARGAAAT